MVRLTMSVTLLYMTTLVGVAQRGWSGHIRDLSHLLRYFFFFFCFLCHAPRLHLLTNRDDHTPTRVFAVKKCACWVSRHHMTTFRGKPLPLQKNLTQMAGISIFKHKRSNFTIHISRKVVNHFGFTGTSF